MSETIRLVDTGINLTPNPPMDVRVELQKFLSVPVWSDNPDVLCAGRIMGWSRTATYRAVNDGFLPVIKVSATRMVVSTRVLLALVDGEQA